MGIGVINNRKKRFLFIIYRLPPLPPTPFDLMIRWAHIFGHMAHCFFFNFQLCSMICIDVHWCSLIIDDVHLGPMIYMDVRWFYMCFLRCVCVWCSLFFNELHWFCFVNCQRISVMFIDVLWVLMILIVF